MHSLNKEITVKQWNTISTIDYVFFELIYSSIKTKHVGRVILINQGGTKKTALLVRFLYLRVMH